MFVCFQPEEKELTPEPAPVEVQPPEPCPAASPSPEETDETWEEKEDKLDTENIEPETAKPVEQKYQYKEGEGGNVALTPANEAENLFFYILFVDLELKRLLVITAWRSLSLRPVVHFFSPHFLFSEHWKPINPEEKKRYDREFLLRFQFISASMHKPEGLPHISDVVLDKVGTRW